MAGKTAATKLGIKPGHTVYPINPPGDYATLVGGLPDGATLVDPTLVDPTLSDAGPAADVVHAFARTLGDLATHGRAAVAAVRPGGLVWISYPKGGASELKRDLLWDAVPGWRPVTQIAVDELWSAMRFRPESEIGKG
ncbi:MAG: hypothetical protein AUI14_20595 [Actinobacteria bacterium 13_2_20CM_2_71_6]|nr:MAG: hypothetical protein AUI14_20595 [Actinobacteria bacterium 13_2_20CM_2_71_6]